MDIIFSRQEKVNRPNIQPKSRHTSKDKISQWFKYHEGLYDYQRPKPNFFTDDVKNKSGYKLSYSPGGKLVELKRTLGEKPDGLGKHKGDVIDGYSRESRNRFLKLMFSIDYKKMGTPLFYTLTYPCEYSKDPRVWKRDLDTFIKRLRRFYPDLCGTWRLEPQERGAPHFCGFLWGCDGLSTMKGKREFSMMWFEVVGSGDEKHLRAGTGIVREQAIENRIFYMAKYQTKAEKGGVKQEFDYPVGRYWGCIKRKNFSIAKEEFELDKRLYFKVRRVLKKKLEKCLTKNKFREVIAGKQNGLWCSMSNETILKLLNMIISQEESLLPSSS